jgi:hypothetical protein
LFLKFLIECSVFVLVVVILLPYLIEVSEVASFYLQANYELLFESVDFVFSRVFRIHILAGGRSKHVCYIAHVILYVYFLAKYENWQNGDFFVALCTFCNAGLVFSFVQRYYWDHICRLAWRVWTAVGKYGWRRIALYCISVMSAAFLFTYLVSSAYSVSWDYMREGVLGRLEKNVLDIEEDRTNYSITTEHPLTKGLSDPKIFQQIYRYSMEDVTMACEVVMVELADGRPGPDYISWRHNGMRIALTDRHRQGSDSGLHFQTVVAWTGHFYFACYS